VLAAGFDKKRVVSGRGPPASCGSARDIATPGSEEDRASEAAKNARTRRGGGWQRPAWGGQAMGGPLMDRSEHEHDAHAAWHRARQSNPPYPHSTVCVSVCVVCLSVCLSATNPGKDGILPFFLSSYHCRTVVAGVQCSP